MELTKEDCNYLLNAIDTHIRAGKNGGVFGVQNAAIMTHKLQEHVKGLGEEEKAEDA